MIRFRSWLVAGLVALVGPTAVRAADPAPAPAYQIVLRSRHATATPSRTKNAQTGGGSIVVEQPEPNTLVVTMAGAAVAGSDLHSSAAAVDFAFLQELEIVPVRRGVGPPRIGLVTRVIGTLQATDAGCLGACGSADQGLATACLAVGDVQLLTATVEATAAAGGQESAINHRAGPFEAVAAAGAFHLNASFRLAAGQGRGTWHRQYAVADFDPAPQLDARWADALRPFRAIPRRDFGFKIVVRVIEEPRPAAPQR